MTYTAVVRQRGQLTIPDSMRESIMWLREGSVVEIEAAGDGVKIQPAGKQSVLDWEKIWMMIRLSRSFRSKSTEASASQFIVEDREKH